MEEGGETKAGEEVGEMKGEVEKKAEEGEKKGEEEETEADEKKGEEEANGKAEEKLGRGGEKTEEEGIGGEAKTEEGEKKEEEGTGREAKTEEGPRTAKQEAIRLWKLSAEKKFAPAYSKLGELLILGEEVEEDLAEGTRCLAKAYGLGSTEAADRLKELIRGGVEVKMEPAEFTKIYSELATSRFPPGMYEFARCLHYGIEVEKNLRRALEFYGKAADRGYTKAYMAMATVHQERADPTMRAKMLRAAAESGDPEAARSLAECYFSGTGVEPNSTEGVRLLKFAAKRGDQEAIVELGKRLDKGEGIEPREVVDYLRFAAESNSEARYRLAKAYAKGWGVEKDSEEALQLLLSASGDTCPRATCKLAEYHLRGLEGFPLDPEEGLRLYHLALSQGSPRAGLVLGQLYEKGETVLMDKKEAQQIYTTALTFLKRGASKLRNEITVRLACLLELGEGSTEGPNEARAYQMFSQVAETGHPEALWKLGCMLAEGRGCMTDQEKALQYWQLAAEKGHEEAATVLSVFWT
jgi:TPR repeat protein